MTKEGFRESCNILVFVALPEEHDRLLEQLPPVNDFSDGEFICTEHDIQTNGFRMISILAKGMGNDNAFEATSKGIEYFDPNLIVCLGIAGSLTDDMKLGDVSVSNEIIDVTQNMKITEKAPVKVRRHPTKRRRATRTGNAVTVIELSPKTLPVMDELAASFRFIRSHPTLKGRLAQWQQDATDRRAAIAEAVNVGGLAHELQTTTAAEVGAIISGPVVASSVFRDTLKKIDRKVLAIETESSGVFRAARTGNIPCVTIRGISDHADLNKNALERTTKNAARQLAAENAITYLKLQLENPNFMRVARGHAESKSQPTLFDNDNGGPINVLKGIADSIDKYLEKMSPEYKHRPNNANLPIPRITKEVIQDEIEDLKDGIPKSIFETIDKYRKVFLKIPRSFPNQTLAWSVAQALLKHEIDSKQILPLVVCGDEIIPPQKGIKHATGIQPNLPAISEHFSPVVIVSEPQFHSQPKITYLIEELQKYPEVPVVVISRADTPTEQIDRLKADLFLTDHNTAPVPFHEIAAYLETAFEMKPDEADSVASRLDDTFSKFRLHTHPAYFVGLQEATLDALIQANHRAELIQLAVDGLLSFVVAFDESPVKLNRTTREEFLAELAYEIKVNHREFTKQELHEHTEAFGKRKALEIQTDLFLRGFFSVGLLNESGGNVYFSVPYLEAYLLAELLRKDDAVAQSYYDPSADEFDHFSFDLYVERGASDKVVRSILYFADETLKSCVSDGNVFEQKHVKPKALSSTPNLLNLAKQMGQAATRLADSSNSPETRMDKQRLLDTRQAVRGKVASRTPTVEKEMPQATRSEFELLDQLSRSSILLATVIGSGAERLDGETKEEIGNKILSTYERFLHFWTINRMKIDFDELRDDLKQDETIDAIISEFELYEEKRDDIRNDLLTFLDDQELRLLSGPGGFLLGRLSSYAGVRSLKPTLDKLKPKGSIEKIFRDAWYMDVEHKKGKKNLKDSLQGYKGSPLFRLIVTNHLMNRIYWHHWQKDSKNDFVDAAKYALAPLGLTTNEDHTRRVLEGPKRLK